MIACEGYDGTDMDESKKPHLVFLLEELISLTCSKKCKDWFRVMRSIAPHIPTSIAHRLGTGLAHLFKSCFNLSMSRDVEKGIVPSTDSDFHAAFIIIKDVIEEIEDNIRKGTMGSYGQASTLWRRLHPDPKPEAKNAAASSTTKKANGGNNQQNGNNSNSNNGNNGNSNNSRGGNRKFLPIENNNPPGISPKCFITNGGNFFSLPFCQCPGQNGAMLAS